MGTQSTSRKILLKSLVHHVCDDTIIYVFLVDEVEFCFSARIRSCDGIRGLEYTDALESFLMSVMCDNPRISKNLCTISLGYVDGVDFYFPINLQDPVRMEPPTSPDFE
ncbi:hypothetical protein [Xanthomonas euvesicatoria]|uniref:Uncharacterized protein n=1 Tax=Xanthomonas euvesicatoria TaxID=456327 RepID=A0AAW3U9J3_XANEU|nr:hypothetical protein [Xanthomonas euvesicatoria]MBB4725381.1 hypothetical protein [Xanthomonas euvesicatoria]MBB4872080.1 hypothetical protein [Xanthomonas euvesicatoria]